MEPEPMQQKIITADTGDLLVSAAAGSGKTTVLVGRIIEGIISGRLSLDRIMVATFTIEAADNMKQKIEERIEGLLSDAEFVKNAPEETVKRLRDQLILLPQSYIQTLDSFFSRVISEKGHVLAGTRYEEMTDPSCSVISGSELDLLMLDAARSAIAGIYEEEPAQEFYDLTDMFGDGRSDEELADNVVRVYKKLRNCPGYMKFLEDKLSERRAMDERGEIAGCRNVISVFLGLFRKFGAETERKILEVLDTCGEFKETDREAIRGTVTQSCSFAREVLLRSETDRESDLLRFVREGLFGISFAPLPMRRGAVAEQVDELCRVLGPVASLGLLAARIKGEAKTRGYSNATGIEAVPDLFADLLSKDADRLMDEQIRRTAMTEWYTEIIRRTDLEFAAMKIAVKGVDFNDRAHMACLILSSEEASSYYRNKFEEIFIDEYQDNSNIQDAAIEHIVRESGNIFRVGDVKQSIYRFRYADPTMFMRKLDTFSEEDDAEGGRLYRLNRNFRATHEIDAFVNELFDQLMTADGSGIGYSDGHRLIPHKGALHGNKPRVVITNIRESVKDNVLTVSSMLRDVLSEVEYYHNVQGRSYGEICVLARDNKTVQMIADYLQEHGHEANYVDKLYIFGNEDIRGLISMIAVLVNELRDEHVLTLMLKNYPFTNFTVNEIAKIHLHYKEKYPEAVNMALMTKVRSYAEDGDDGELRKRCALFAGTLDDIRNDMVITDIRELTDRLCAETGMEHRDEAARTKLRRFRAWLWDNFGRYGSDIAFISGRLESMTIKIGDSMSVDTKIKDKKKIACMTYHSSKGLEFPCVIVTQLYSSRGKTNSGGSVPGTVTFTREDGIVMKDYDPQEIRLTESFESVSAFDREYLDNNSEEMRLLYVALTRGMSDLSVVLTVKKSDLAKLSPVLCSYPHAGFGSDWWRYGMGVKFTPLLSPMLSALARLGNGRIASALDIGGDGQIASPLSFDGFDLTVNDPPQQIPSSDAGNAGDPDSGDDASDVEGDDSAFMEHTDDVPLHSSGTDEAGMPVFEEYGYPADARTPFKVSVSELKNAGFTGILPVTLEVNTIGHFEEKRKGVVSDTPDKVGTLIHKVFRFIDLDRAADRSIPFADILGGLVDDGIINVADIPVIETFEEGIRSFAGSSIGIRLASADQNGTADFELPVVFAASEGEGYTLVQGIIDTVFTDSEGTVVIDYKTDRFPAGSDEESRAQEASRKHRFQVDCYAASLQACGMNVTSKYLYLVRYGEFVRI